MPSQQTSRKPKDVLLDFTPNRAGSIDIRKVHLPRNSSDNQWRNASLPRHNISESNPVAHQDHSYTSDMSHSPNSSSPTPFYPPAGPQFATSPICAADALAAVNLLPLPQAPITSSRSSGIMSASNNITTLSHNEPKIARSMDNQTWNEATEYDRRPNHSCNGSDGTKPKSAPIIIVEHLNPLNKEIFGYPQTMGHREGTSENKTSTIRNSTATTQSNVLSTSAHTRAPQSSVRTKTRPKRRDMPPSPGSPQQQDHNDQRPGIIASGKRQKAGLWHPGRYDVRGFNSAIPFSWDTYLSRIQAKVAPLEAFRQPRQHPKNLFEVHMKLEARDPRNFSNWSLASVIHVEGLQIGLRLEGTDKMNDLFELIDSENIRPIGSCPGEPLLAPTNYSKDIKTYPRFVEKILEKATYATPECFPPPPPKPLRNLFEPGMKLEAVDRKHRDLICPATVACVKGDQIRVSFDGWSDSFDYWCEYYSRDLFPINYCRDVGRAIQQPGGWPEILKSSPPPTPSYIRNSTTPDRPPYDDDSSPSTRRLASALVRSATQAPKLGAPGIFPMKKRGRPKKNVHADLDNQSTQSANTSISSETNNIVRNIMELENHISTESATKILDMINDEDLGAELPIEGFQCQRTSVYPWKLMRLEREKRKQHTDHMPQDTFPVATEQIFSVNGISTPTSSVKTASEDRDTKKPKIEQPHAWTIDDVINLITKHETFTQYSELFRDNEIDGEAFLLLTNEVLIKHMGLKVGHAVKMIDLVNQVKRQYDLE